MKKLLSLFLMFIFIFITGCSDEKNVSDKIEPQYDTVTKTIHQIAMLCEDGKIIGNNMHYKDSITKDWEDVIEIKEISLEVESGIDMIFGMIGLKKDGTVIISDIGDKYFSYPYIFTDEVNYDEKYKKSYKEKIKSLKNIVDIAFGYHNIYALKEDGTIDVINTYEDANKIKIENMENDIFYEDESEKYKEYLSEKERIIEEIENLKNVKAIESAEEHFVAILDDGSVIYKNFGDYENKIFEKISEWENISKIEICNFLVVGIKKDGTIVYEEKEENLNNRISKKWKNIKNVAIDSENPFCNYIIAVKEDGKILYSETKNNYDFSELEKWENIENVYTSCGFVIGIKKDGSIVTCGDIKQKNLNKEEVKNLKVNK